MANSKRGRKTKYTPATVAAIVAAIEAGNTQDDAALLAGVGRTTFYEWLAEKPDFADVVEKAHGVFKENQIKAIRAAGFRANKMPDGTIKTGGSWQANAWLLERKYPTQFGQRMVIQISAEDAELWRWLGYSSPHEGYRALMEKAKADREREYIDPA